MERLMKREGKERVENYKHVATALKKRMMLVFEDEETTTITQKPCVRKSMSFEGEQRRIEYNGSRKKERSFLYINQRD